MVRLLRKRTIRSFLHSCYRTRRRRLTSTLFLVALCTLVLAGSTRFHMMAGDDSKSHSVSKRDTGGVAVSCEQPVTSAPQAAPLAQCWKPNVTSVEAKKDKFQLVSTTAIYTFSAYFDPRLPGEFNVRIFGIAPVYDHRVFCLMKSDNGNYYSSLANVILTSVDLELHANFRYKPYIFTCNVSESWGTPVTVSLTTEHCVRPDNMLIVTAINPISDTKMDNKISICLRTMHKLRSPYPIIEFMELQHELGVSHVYVYGVEEVSESVQATLDYYIENKQLTVVPWELPVKNSAVFEEPGEIAIHGQHALNNDCVYRSMNEYRFTFMHDMDEFIIARSPKLNTHQTLIKHVDEKYNKGGKPVASYYFTNCYFCLKKEDYEGPHAFTLERTVRHECQKKEMERAWKENPNQKHLEGNRKAAKKTMIYPKRVLEFGVHGIIKTMPGYEKELKTPPFDAQMHHYKKPHDIACSIEDKTLVNKYDSVLKKKINAVCKKLKIDPVS